MTAAAARPANGLRVVAATIASPTAAFVQLRSEPRTRTPTVLLAGSFVLLLIAAAPGVRDAMDVAVDSGAATPRLTNLLFWSGAVVWLFLGASGTLTYAAVLHVLARALGGRGSFRATAAVAAHALVFIALRLALTAAAIVATDLETVLAHLGGLVYLDPFVLGLVVVSSIGLRVVHGLTIGRASLAAALPVAVLQLGPLLIARGMTI